MSRHYNQILFTSQDLTIDQSSNFVALKEYDSYHLFGSTDTSHGSFVVQCGVNGSDFYDTSNKVSWTVSGDVFGNFVNDANYVRVKALQDTSNVTLILAARKGD